jgi:hypothetical protein
MDISNEDAAVDQHKGGKQVAEVFDHGTLGEGMRAAIEEIKSGYEEVIDGWHRA